MRESALEHHEIRNKTQSSYDYEISKLAKSYKSKSDEYKLIVQVICFIASILFVYSIQGQGLSQLALFVIWCIMSFGGSALATSIGLHNQVLEAFNTKYFKMRKLKDALGQEKFLLLNELHRNQDNAEFLEHFVAQKKFSASHHGFRWGNGIYTKTEP